MKKIILMTGLFFFLSILYIRVFAAESEQPLMKYSNPSQPVTYFNTSSPVMLPAAPEARKNELRGLYVSTFDNVDFNVSADQAAFETQFEAILNTMASDHLNTLIFEVRPMNDAFYKSALNPWSQFLTGTQGQNPGWDPLSWMIAETHARGFVFYAAVNAFRVSDYTTLSLQEYIDRLNPGNFAYQHPDLIMSTNQNTDNQIQLFLNPGAPEVQQFVEDSIMEIVKNYDVDAIDLENYYYPSVSFNQSMDSLEYENDNPNHLNINEWRRNNITSLIQNLKYEISNYNNLNNKAVQFGVNCDKVWNNIGTDKDGSNTDAAEGYSTEYADTRFWVKSNDLDFIIPEANTSFEDSYAPYADVIDWWNKTVSGTKVNLYIGQFPDYYGTTASWQNPSELTNELLYNQKESNVKGTVLYSYHSLSGTNSVVGSVMNTVINDFWNLPALLPASENVSGEVPSSVTNLFVKMDKNGVVITWQRMNHVQMYLIYRFTTGETVNLNSTKNLIAVIHNPDTDSVSFIDSSAQKNNKYNYYITAVGPSYIEGLPKSFAIDLSPNKSFNSELILLIFTAVLSAGVITYSSIRIFKKEAV